MDVVFSNLHNLGFPYFVKIENTYLSILILYSLALFFPYRFHGFSLLKQEAKLKHSEVYLSSHFLLASNESLIYAE